MRKVEVGRFVLTFDSEMEHEIYSEPPDFYGVRFFVGDSCYDVFCNRYMGERLVITKPFTYGFLRDMPFHLGTAWQLPEGITVSRGG